MVGLGEGLLHKGGVGLLVREENGGLPAEELAVQHAADERGGQGDEHAVDDEPADVRAHVPGDGHGAGGGDDEGVRAGEADDEGRDQRVEGQFAFAGHFADEADEDDEGRVEEHRDGDDVAGEVQGQRGFFPPAQPQHGVGDFAGAPGFVEDLPHGDAEQDDDADVAHRVPEALAGRLDDGHRVKAGAYAHQQAADEQREERVQFELDDQRQDDRDGHKKGQDEREVTVHERLLWKGLGGPGKDSLPWGGRGPGV